MSAAAPSPAQRWLVFDPYLGSRGGGERYMIAFRDALAASGRDAVFAGPGADAAALARMGLGDVTPRAMSAWKFVGASRRFDVTVCLTNHPPVPSLARRSVVVVQFPFPDRQANPLRRAASRWMLRRSTVVVYSEFAREWLRKRWRVDGTVLSPPVQLGSYRPDAKEPLILNVGRFFPSQHSKRQDALVAAFAALPEAARAGWRLVLAGGVADDADSRAYLAKVQDAARGLAVDVMPNVDAATMVSLYERASLYWHATGLGRGPDEPEKAEHFGISTVEAMSYGAVPVVIADGGQPEIVTADAGVLWHDEQALIAESAALMGDDHRRRALAQGAARAAAKFGTATFDRGVAALAEQVMPRSTRPVSYVVVAFHRPVPLESLLARAAGGDVELIVVNVESDPEIARVADAAGARRVDLASNVGYAAAVNAGVGVASADVVVFSNDDLSATAGDIAALADIVRSGSAGVAVPAIFDHDGRHELSIAALPTVSALAREWMCLPDRPVPFLAGVLPVAKWRAPAAAAVISAATAAFVATTRDQLRAEPLPEAYFLYWEESEWFWRLARRGVVVEYHPEIAVTHLGGRDDVRPDKSRLLARNAVRCVRRTQGRLRAAVAVPVVVLWNLRLLLIALLRRRHVAARWAGVVAASTSFREVWR